MRGLSPTRLALAVPAGLLPWSWFLLRDALGGFTDVLAIVLPVAAVLVAGALAFVAVRRRLAWVAAGSTLLMAAVAVLLPWLPADAGSVAAGRSMTVAGANVSSEPYAFDTLRELSPDVLVVSEVSDELEFALNGVYPHHYTEPADGGPNVGVYSRFPFRSVTPSSRDLPGLRIELVTPAGPAVLYALHVPRPWYVDGGPQAHQATVGEHYRLVAELARRAAVERDPVIMVGDLNETDRGRGYRTLLDTGQLVDAMRDGGVGPTSTGKWAPLLLRIDHLLVSSGWCGDRARSVALPATDHRGVVATVGPCEP